MTEFVPVSGSDWFLCMVYGLLSRLELCDSFGWQDNTVELMVNGTKYLVTVEVEQ